MTSSPARVSPSRYSVAAPTASNNERLPNDVDLVLIQDFDEFLALAGQWDHLTLPSPMQSHVWLSTWWEYYAETDWQLFVPTLWSAGNLVGAAPWYATSTHASPCIRWLGDGEVCSDHHDLLCHPAFRNQFRESLTDWLQHTSAPTWSRLHLQAVDDIDSAVRSVVTQLHDQDFPSVIQCGPSNCYVELPDDWEVYLKHISKNHRKRCRKWKKAFFDTGRAVVRVHDEPRSCLTAWEVLTSLHNERRAAVGDVGAFEKPKFNAFHRAVIPRLAEQGLVQLRLLDVDGETVAAEYTLQDAQRWYAYQSGLSRAGADISAGNLSILALVYDAIDCGRAQLDLLRGSEGYKASWGAVPCRTDTITVRRPSTLNWLTTIGETTWISAKARVRQLKQQYR